MEKKRSVGVTIFGWYFILVNLIALLIIRLLRPEDFLNNLTERPIVIVRLIVYLIIGIGILKLKNWARIGTIVIGIFYIIAAPVAILTANIVGILFLLSGISMLYFFTRPKVKEQFK